MPEYTSLFSTRNLSTTLEKVHIPYEWLSCRDQLIKETTRHTEGFINVQQPLYMVVETEHENAFWNCRKKTIHHILSTTTYTPDGDFYYFSVDKKICVKSETAWTRINQFLDVEPTLLLLSADTCLIDKVEYFSAKNFYVNDHPSIVL
jgi:hypothetical protein